MTVPILQQARRFLAQRLLQLYSVNHKNRPAPISTILRLRRLAGGGTDPLAIHLSQTRSTGSELNNPYLAEVLAQDELGTWALDADTLNLLEQTIHLRHPAAILEFGCGISTICFARYMQETYACDMDVLRVYSIEQNHQYAQNVGYRLARLGLDHIVSIIQAPIHQQVVEGVDTECYHLTDENLATLRRYPDFVVIDGPSGRDGIRFGTLPMIRSHLAPNAHFFLDDALRDGELLIAQQWSKLAYISVTGMHLCGKGLLTGTIHGSILPR